MPHVNTTSRVFLKLAASAGAALLIVGMAACGGDDKDKQDTAVATVDQRATPDSAAATATTTTPGEQAAEATPPPFPSPNEDAELVRLMIPSAKVNAPLQIKGVNARNEMENPDGKDNVAWYNFTSKPGFGSNAVFSGHVDWYTREQGVFWYLRDVKEGDEVMVRLSDGMELKYRIAWNQVYAADEAPVAEIVGPTTAEVVTLITCEGVFNPGSQDYDKRRVVRAERIA